MHVGCDLEIDEGVVLAAWKAGQSQCVLIGQIPYIWKRRSDGLYIINLAKTWEKLMLAARIVVAIENPADGALTALSQGASLLSRRSWVKFITHSQCMQGIVDCSGHMQDLA